MPSKIEWTDETWNPTTGCTKVGPGCTHCYAERMARRLADRFGYPEAPHHFDVTLHPDRLEQPPGWRKPRQIFVCSMSDLFHEDVPSEFIFRVWQTMFRSRRHTFQILTKRPERMLKFVRSLEMRPGTHYIIPNIWLGVSVENQAAADERIPPLLQTPAAVRFVSLEPLLGPIDLDGLLLHGPSCLTCGGELSKSWGTPGPVQPCPKCGQYGYRFRQKLNWIIVGGESGPGARPMHPQWARDVRDECYGAGVPFFFKQWGAWEPIEKTNERLQEWADKPFSSKFCCLHCEYGQPAMGGPYADPGWQMFERIGKKRAGRLLDGQLWEQMPALTKAPSCAKME